MNIRRLTITNYCQFPDLDLVLPFRAGRPITLIKGRNGFGKSNLLNAFQLVFSGFPRDDGIAFALMNAGRPDAAPGPTSIRLELEVRPNVTWTIERMLHPNPASGPVGVSRFSRLHLDNGTTVTDDEKIREHLSKHLPLQLLDYFMFNLDYSQTLERLIEDHEGEAVVAALEEILGLHLFRRLREDLENPLRDIRRRARLTVPPPAQLQQDRDALERSLREAERQLATLRRERNEIDNELTEANRKREDLLRTFNPEVEKRRQSLDLRRGEVDAELKKIEVRLRDHVARDLPLRLIGPILPRILDAAETAAALYDAREESARMRETAQIIATDLARGGPPLASQLDEHGRELLFERLLRVLAVEEFGEDEPQPPCLSTAEIRELRATIKKAQQAGSISQLLDLRDTLRDEKERVRRELPMLTQDPALGRRISEVITDIDSLTAARTVRASAMDRLRQEIVRLREQIDSKEKAIDEATRASEDVAHATRMVQFIERIRLCVDDLAHEQRLGKVQAIEDSATNALRAITNKPGYYERIELDRETFDIKVGNVHGDMIAKTRLSTGEKSVLAFCVLRALQEASTWKVPLVIEAPLTPMDDEHTRNILGKFLPHLGEQVILLVKTGELSAAGEKQLEPFLNQTYELARPADDREETVLHEIRKGTNL